MQKQQANTVKLRLSGLKLGLDEALREAAALSVKAAAVLQIREAQILQLSIHKKSLDARTDGPPLFIYTLDLICRKPVSGRVRGRGLAVRVLEQEPVLAAKQCPAQRLKLRPVIVGAGPAGLFAALALAEAGYAPLLLEQGQPVERRAADVARFWREGLLDPWSNVQFGEGGAGTFSDGKLTFRGKDARARTVAEVFVAAGADPSILYWHKPHLGSDRLLQLLPRLRRRIEQAGGSFCFGCRLGGLDTITHAQGRKLAGLRLLGVEETEMPAQVLILAPGNGARATYEMLAEAGLALAAKPFAIGLRIEHAQSLIDRAQYGAAAGHAALAAADYQLKYQAADGRSYYSFCMCPGGQIVNAASEPGGLLTNGISRAARASGYANSALVGAVAPGRDFPDQPLAALAWQRGLEQAAFQAGGRDYSLPVCLVEDFLRGFGASEPPPGFQPLARGYQAAELRPLLPEPLAEGLAAALQSWLRQIPDFAAQAVLAGLETRTSAPVRILRGADGQSLNLAGLYPAGEGAGYAGGIVSSAIDGLAAAEAVMEQYLPPLA